MKKSIPIDDLRVDVGMSQEQAEAAIPIGTPDGLSRRLLRLWTRDKLCGKSMDDRSCFVTLLRAAELLKDKPLDVDLYIMGSTREEVSGAGAKAATYGINPDLLCGGGRDPRQDAGQPTANRRQRPSAAARRSASAPI